MDLLIGLCREWERGLKDNFLNILLSYLNSLSWDKEERSRRSFFCLVGCLDWRINQEFFRLASLFWNAYFRQPFKKKGVGSWVKCVTPNKIRIKTWPLDWHWRVLDNSEKSSLWEGEGAEMWLEWVDERLWDEEVETVYVANPTKKFLCGGLEIWLVTIDGNWGF